ncbi:MAG: glycosyltransferase family A protein [Sedimenticola sp.]
MKNTPDWSVVVFAYNVADTIESCLTSIIENTIAINASIYVLANGCTDTTELRVNEYIRSHNNVYLIKLGIGDKANAWNTFVHEVAPEATTCFFVDGDVVVGEKALITLSKTLDRNSEANAVGALPGNGRDCKGWSQRMVNFGYFAGGLYALRGSFLDQLRQQKIMLPVGLIGEDFVLSYIVKGVSTRPGIFTASRKLIIEQDACFYFRSLSVMKPSDWWVYFRRLIRYQIRRHQISMLLARTSQTGFQGMPKSINDLYLDAEKLPDYYWRGRITPFDMIAVWLIRREVQAARTKRDQTT